MSYGKGKISYNKMPMRRILCFSILLFFLFIGGGGGIFLGGNWVGKCFMFQ